MLDASLLPRKDAVHAHRNGQHCLTPTTQQWLRGLTRQIPEDFEIHHGDTAREAAAKLHLATFMINDRVFPCEMPGIGIELRLVTSNRFLPKRCMITSQ